MSTVASAMPMGWGRPEQTTQQKRDDELRAYERLESVVPQRLMRATAKAVKNAAIIHKTRELMTRDGMDDGMSLLHLFEAIIGKPIDFKPQLIGSCVASGDKETTALRALAEVFVFNDPEEIPGVTTNTVDNLSFFAPFSYRAGRKIAGINGGAPSGFDDGSLCIPHIQGKMQYGNLPCSAAGLVSDAFPEPQGKTVYRAWGANDKLLTKFAAQAKPFVLEESEAVESAEESKILLVEHLKPQNNCSDWAFKRGQAIDGWKTGDGKQVYEWVRDTRDSWSHNLSIVAYVLVNGEWWSIVKNTWGNYHDGRPWFPIRMETDDKWSKDSDRQSVGNLNLGDNPPIFPSE